MKAHLFRCTVAIGAMLACTAANAAVGDAQAVPIATAAPEAASGLTDGDIIVTARRREEALQSIPVSISAFNQNTLTTRGVVSIADLQNQAPALSTNSYNSRDALTISIRGVGQGTNGSPPGVVLYLNEVPITADTFGQASLPGSGIFYDLQNVQVLRGPQGTLFGRNSVGGAILFTTQKPTNDFGGYVEAGIGNYDNRQVEGALNIPLIEDKLLVRLAGRVQRRDGYTRSLGTPLHPTGTDLDNVNATSGRVSITFMPTERLTNEFVAVYSNSKSRGQSLALSAVNPAGLIPGLFPNYLDLFAQQQALGKRKILATDLDFRDNHKFFGITNTTKFELSDDITFRNIFGYEYGKSLTATDNDSTTLQLLNGVALPDHIRQYTEEVQLQGESFDGKLNWVTGLYYLDSPAQSFTHFKFQVFFVPNNQDLQRASSAKAAYAQATYALLPDLKLTAGIRYTWDKVSGETRNLPASGICPSPAPAGQNANCGIFLKGKYDAPTWNVSLDYQVNKDVLVYLATRRGYRSGGFNFLATSDGNILPFTPEKLTDGEFGVKLSGRVGGMNAQLNSDVFYQDYKDIQVQQTVFLSGQTRTLISNAAAARAYGLETEGFIEPVRDLRIGGYFNYLNFKYTDLGSGVDLSFIRDQRPKYKYGLNGEFALPLQGDYGTLHFNASYGWTSSTGDTSVPGSFIPSHGVLNLNAQWADVGGLPIDASLYATNATNGSKLIRTVNLYNLVGFSQGSYEEPRMYGVRLRYRFG